MTRSTPVGSTENPETKIKLQLAPRANVGAKIVFLEDLSLFCYISETFKAATKPEYARIAQLVEHITDTDGVLGSNPSTRTNKPPLGGFARKRACYARV
jgi:hypothetical protein